MNSLAQHASQMLRMEDRGGHHQKSSNTTTTTATNNNPTVLPSLFLPQPPPSAQHQHGGLFLPHLSFNATAGGVVPTARQLYAALLDIQLAAASHSHSHNHNSSSSTTTTTTTTTSSAILLPPGALSSQFAAQLSQAVASSPQSAAKRNINHGHRSLAGKLGCGARKHTTCASSPTALPQSSSSSSSTPSSKRGKKTSGRVCGECRTDNTLQWRLGPDGQASLCNACGQRFQRRKQAMAQNNNNNNNGNQHKSEHHHKSEPHSPATSPSPVSSPPSHHHIKREPVASPTHAGGQRRSDIYSLLN